MGRRTWMEGVFGQFLRESTLHGVKYIGSPDKHPCEKLFWISAVLLSVGLSCYMVEEIYRKYNENPIIISFQPQETTIAQIPFPALTLCNVNILKTQIMKDILRFLTKEENKYIDANFTEVGNKYLDALLLSEHMTHYCLAAPSVRRLLNQTLQDVFGTVDYVQVFQDYMAKDEYVEYMQAMVTSFSHELEHNISTFKGRASHHCEDMILKCMWAKEFIPCNELFTRIYTQHGGCCVFNMMPKYFLKIPENVTEAESALDAIPEDERRQWQKFDANNLILMNETDIANIKFPKHQKAGGKPYGLSILINPELDMYSTCNSHDAVGFKMLAHSPVSFPSIPDYGVAIPPSSEVFIDIEPQVTTSDEDALLNIGIDKRNCYFPSDKKAKLSSYRFYSASNCMDECIAKLTYEKCSCVRYFMPHNSTQVLCGARKLDCSEEVRQNVTASVGKSGQCNQCIPACTEIHYKMQLSHFPLKDNITTYVYNTSEETNKMAKNYSIVHIFMGTDSLYAKERKRLYDHSDLLANAGGILSLTLGFSIISVIEVIYFFTIRVFFQRKEDKAGEDEDNEDEDFYSRSRGETRKRKLSAPTKPRIMDGLETQSKMNSYYNWAMTATSTASNIMNVKPSYQTTSVDTDSQWSKGRRRIPAFQLLKSEITEKSVYPYLS